MADVGVEDRASAVRRVYWDRSATIVTAVLAVLTVVMLGRLSAVYYGNLTFIAAWMLALALGCAWLVLVVRAVLHGRIWGPLIVMPIVTALLLTASCTELLAKLRWDLTRPNIDAYVETLPSPPPPLTREPSGTDIETYDTAFRSACPSLLGTYRIVECRTIPGGYVFLTSVDNDGQGAGVAYLPLTGDSYDWSLQVLQGVNEASSWPLDEPWYVVLVRVF